MVVFSLPLSPYPHPHLPTTFKISFIFFFVLVLKDRYLHLHTTLALAHAPRTFPFSNGLLVGNHSEKKKKTSQAFPRSSSQSATTRLHRILVGTRKRQRLVKPRPTPATGRFPGHPARRRCGPVPQGHRRPTHSPPCPHRGALPSC